MVQGLKNTWEQLMPLLILIGEGFGYFLLFGSLTILGWFLWKCPKEAWRKEKR